MSEMDPDTVQGNIAPDLAIETPEADAIEQSQLVADEDEDDESYR